MTTWVETKRKKRDIKIYALIVQYYLDTGCTPTHNELAKKYGGRSKGSRGAINPHLKRLVEKKAIEKDDGGHICLPAKTVAYLDKHRKQEKDYISFDSVTGQIRMEK